MEDRFRYFLRSMLSNLGNNNDSGYEPVAPLSKDELAEWEALTNERARVKSMVETHDAKKRLFWGKMEEKTGIFDRNLKIEAGIVMVEKKEQL